MLPVLAKEGIKPSVPGKALLDAFLEGRSPATMRAYQKALSDFAVFAGLEAHEQAAALERLMELSQGEANLLAHRYRSHLLERNLAPATVNHRLAALRSAVKLGRTFGRIAWSLDVPNVRGEAMRDTRGPGHHVVAEMLKAAQSQGGGMGLRDAAMLRLLYDLALRRSEVVSLDWGNVDLPAGRLAVLRKGRRQRTWLSLPSSTQEALAAWMGWVHPEGQTEPTAPLFCNFDRSEKDRNGGRLTASGLYAVIRKLGRQAGRDNVHPHAIRHTAVTQAVEAAQAKGYNLKDVLPYSGHRDVSTLLIYVDQQRDVQGDLAESVGGTI